ncbi:MAG: MATE family efflux transporter [Oscillospiraceae bacterium]|nr:MATE family efflux transporter [Oscillospiraceae bacterium]
MNQRNEDLTTGPIIQKLLRFALPLLLGTLVQQLYSTVDLIFVGNVIDKTASAAIGASTLLITCLIGFFGGLAVGAGVVIAQSWGERDTDKLRRAIGNTAALALAGGAVLALLGWLLAPGYLRLIRTPEEIRANAEAYLRIYFLSLPSIVAYNFGAGMLRALGDSKNPLLAQLVGGLVNVAADWLLLRVLANGVVGVAWASLFSQTVAAALVARKLCRLDNAFALRLRGIRFDPALLKKTVAIGLPTGAQALVITLSNVVVQAHINSFGADAIAAFTAYFKVELIIYLPIMALGQAIMTFSGQNSGAGQLARIRRGTRDCLLISLGLTAILSAVSLFFGGALFRLFIKEPSVIALGRQIIAVTFPYYVLYPVHQILGDSLRGQGKTKVPMLIVLLNLCLIRSALLFWIVPHTRSIQSVAAAYPVTWGLTALGMCVYYCSENGLISKRKRQN